MLSVRSGEVSSLPHLSLTKPRGIYCKLDGCINHLRVLASIFRTLHFFWKVQTIPPLHMYIVNTKKYICTPPQMWWEFRKIFTPLALHRNTKNLQSLSYSLLISKVKAITCSNMSPEDFIIIIYATLVQMKRFEGDVCKSREKRRTSCSIEGLEANSTANSCFWANVVVSIVHCHFKCTLRLQSTSIL